MLQPPPFAVEIDDSPLPAGAAFIVLTPVVLAFYGVVAIFVF